MIPHGRPIAGKWDIPRGRKLALWRRMTPPQLFVCSFVFLIAVGTLGLMYLPGLYVDQPLGWLDALFTTTSAVCVTGLTVVDTATYFTFAGQAYILLMIQLGGLGMLAFTSLIILVLGKRLSLRETAITSANTEAAPYIDSRRLTFDIVRFTFVFEALGAFALYVLWIPDLGWRGALWPAIFHSVSAFCNAGFSTFSDSLMSHQQSPFTLLVISAMIVLGGLSFLTHEELAIRFWRKKARPMVPLSLHSRLVVVTTVALIVVGWALFAIFEWNNVLFGLEEHHKLVNALFLSITPRTAGFQNIDYRLATDSTNLLTMLLMMVGGSPGSTAGGMKTTTFALIGVLAWSRLRGWTTTTLWSSSVRPETTARAVGLFAIASAMATAGIFFLTTFEHSHSGRNDLIGRTFEAISAFNTVGLSMAVTPELSGEGLWTTILLMFFGRVGPLTLASALTLHRSGIVGFRYAYEDVVVG